MSSKSKGKSEFCTWSRDTTSQSLNVWKGKCDYSQYFEAGNPLDNKYNYCPGCGRRLMVNSEFRAIGRDSHGDS
jgi:predicted Fe-S protein YdhL (DUF1289 family)